MLFLRCVLGWLILELVVCYSVNEVVSIVFKFSSSKSSLVVESVITLFLGAETVVKGIFTWKVQSIQVDDSMR